jgi:hypothetical protein
MNTLRPAACRLVVVLNATGAPGEIAARAGNRVRALQHVYTHCIDGREDLIGQQIEDTLDPDSSTPPSCRFASRTFSNLYSGHTTWGGGARTHDRQIMSPPL